MDKQIDVSIIQGNFLFLYFLYLSLCTFDSERNIFSIACVAADTFWVFEIITGAEEMQSGSWEPAVCFPWSSSPSFLLYSTNLSGFFSEMRLITELLWCVSYSSWTLSWRCVAAGRRAVTSAQMKSFPDGFLPISTSDRGTRSPCESQCVVGGFAVNRVCGGTWWSTDTSFCA